MQKLEGCDDRALILEEGWLNVMRWGASQHRFPISEVGPSEVARNDKGKLLGLFGQKVERVRICFGEPGYTGRLATSIWLPLAREQEARDFAAAVDAAREAAA